MTRIALVIITDGRVDYLDETIESARVNLHGSIDSCHIVNDEPDAHNHIAARYGDFRLHTHGRRMGLACAVRSAWTAAKRAGASHVFHLEDDFTFNEPVHVGDMRAMLDGDSRIAQLVLKRQAWNDEERAAGGIIESHPEDYTDRLGWVEHRRIFSLNPCLIPMDVCELGWPDGNEAEFTRVCVDAGYVFGFWGDRNDPPRVHHIGERRAAGWAL